jgi:hypothetical protein
MSAKQVVALKFDVDALKHSMRYAFASDITVIQELIQNARRAGASTVWVNTGVSPAGENTLSVLDNGCGLMDFQVLLQVANSGWSDETKANEGPYGMGFLSAIYGAKHVEVVSQGKVLRLDQEGVLNDREFEVEVFDGSLPTGTVTSVTMFGLDTVKILNNISSIVRGYPIDVIVNGQTMNRPDSLDGSFCKVGVGHIKRVNATFNVAHVRVYLQGFAVRTESLGYRSVQHDVVHLDPAKFHGKFPDRDVVVNQAEMMAEVTEQLRSLYTETLLEARKRLSPVTFMENYYDMAASLGMLQLFNDIEVIPKSFMQQVCAMPHDTEYPQEYLFPGNDGEFFTKASLAAGEVVLAELETYTTEYDTENSKRWIFAYAAKAWTLKKQLDEHHWLHGLVTVHEESDVTLEPVGVIRRGNADGMRLQCLGAPGLVLCEDIKVSMGDISFLLGEPVANEEDNVIYVVVRDQAPLYIENAVVQQLASYRWDDDFHEDERDDDVHAINQMARELASNSPEEQLALSIEAAISDYSKVRSLTCTIQVDAKGKVKVLSLGHNA